MRSSLIVGLLFLAIIPIVIGQACSSDSGLKGSGQTSSASTIDAGTAAAKPILSCNVINTLNNQIVDHITDLSSSTSFAPTRPVASGGLVLKVDCSASTSPTGGSLRFSFTQNGVPMQSNGAVTQFPATTPMAPTIGIAIADSSGTSTSKTFNIPVTCNPAAPGVGKTQMVVNGNALSISKGAGTPDMGEGYLDVSFAGVVVSGGIGPFLYAVDLNGDGRFDNYNKTLYSSSTTLSDMYTLFSGVRNVGIRIYDDGCKNVVSTVKQNFDFATVMPAKETGPMAVKRGYYYVQGDVSSASTDLADNVNPFQSVESPPPAGLTPQHVICTYNKSTMGGNGVFQIKGLNTYDDGSIPGGVNAQLTHGVKALKVSDVIDAGGTGPYVNAATLTSLTYQSAASPDSNLTQSVFKKTAASTNCAVTISIERAIAAVPCSGGTGINDPAIIVLGKYSCDGLTTSVAPTKSVNIDNGYFYCEIAPDNQCVGGGQGGGGAPPVEF